MEAGAEENLWFLIIFPLVRVAKTVEVYPEKEVVITDFLQID